MIIGIDLVVRLGLSSNLKRKFLKWGGVTVLTKEPRGLLEKPDIISS